MLNHLRMTWAMIAILAGMMGCGSYSSPNSAPTAPDSTGDSTPPPPGYLLK